MLLIFRTVTNACSRINIFQKHQSFFVKVTTVLYIKRQNNTSQRFCSKVLPIFPPSKQLTMKVLAVFDFDHTILDDNSDTAVIALTDKDNIPVEIRSLHSTEGWTAFMQAIFKLLNHEGRTIDEINNLIMNLQPVGGMVSLITEFHKNPAFDSIIISDSNAHFIDIWLEKNDVGKCFVKVFTNPSKIEDGLLTISPYHNQNTCKLSTNNLCKGRVLEEFMQEQRDKGVVYDRIVYIGDGVNDFCPILRLHKNDLACVRKGYKLQDLVTKAKKGTSFDNSGKPHVILAEIFVWETGDDILKHLQMK
ncbi:pyridoxal phosphate phosphatase PHOSPHO2-like [Tribolium madens]|uniref:pyridoxal phosphate phosphatase PHOSPHO2-like n=1 Tax=Tribolium madens TaxID=41895 RepID=UPI001CF73566|nr:pyridoxal phosphate phosphatase PHOSPHO2-like [Tribolium madens]